MSAVDEIEAAIAKLSELRDEADYHEISGWLCEVIDGASGAIDDPGYAPLTNDPIIVTLHRTIDAQLAILRAQTVLLHLGFLEGDVGSLSDATLALARAINGTTEGAVE